MSGWPDAPSRLLTPAEAAAALGITPKHLGRIAAAHGLRVVRTPGKHRRYVAADVAALHAALQEVPDDDR